MFFLGLFAYLEESHTSVVGMRELVNNRKNLRLHSSFNNTRTINDTFGTDKLNSKENQPVKFDTSSTSDSEEGGKVNNSLIVQGDSRNNREAAKNNNKTQQQRRNTIIRKYTYYIITIIHTSRSYERSI